MNMVYCEKDIDDLLSSLSGLIREDQKETYLSVSEILRSALLESLRYKNSKTGNRSRFTKEDRQVMYMMYRNGSTCKQIAQAYHCSVSYAAKMVDDMVWEKRKKMWLLPDDRR